MRFLSTSTCCWCVDLRTGGLVIGYLSLFSSLSSFAVGGWEGIIASVIASLIWSSWLYGIYNQKHDWMLPGLISAIAGIFFFLWCTLYYAVVTMSELWFIFIFVFATVMQWHIASVMCSLYKQTKETEQNSNTMDPA